MLQYAEKIFVRKPKECRPVVQQMWEAVQANDKKAVYGLIVNAGMDVNGTYDLGMGNSSLTLAKAMLLQEQTILDPYERLQKTLSGSINMASTSEGSRIEDFDGCSLLHLACETGDIGMIELLLQYGANINAIDAKGRTPLHWCIMRGKNTVAKLLLTRGADPRAVDNQGKTTFQLAVDSNFNDNEVLVLLSDIGG